MSTLGAFDDCLAATLSNSLGRRLKVITLRSYTPIDIIVENEFYFESHVRLLQTNNLIMLSTRQQYLSTDLYS